MKISVDEAMRRLHEALAGRPISGLFPAELAALLNAAKAEGMEEAAKLAESRRAHESAAAAHHAGWHPAFEWHTTQHAVAADLRDAIRKVAKLLEG